MPVSYFPTVGGTSPTPATVQGDVLYAIGVNTLAALAKDANATRYLSNTGASNAPAWAQVSLTTGVSGVLPAANGGTSTVNVLAYGADPTGVADSTAAFQAAIDALGTLTGGLVLVPKGTYKLTGVLTLKNGITLRGDGMLASILKQYSTTASAIYAVAPNAQNLVIEDLQIYDALLGLGTRTLGHGIHFDGTGSDTRFSLTRVYVIGFVDSVHGTRDEYSSLTECRVVSPTQDGYHFDTSVSNNLSFLNCGAVAAARYGYYLADHNMVTITNGFSDSSGSDGIRCLRVFQSTLNSFSSEGNIGHAYNLIDGEAMTLNSINAAAAGIGGTIDGVRLDNMRYVVINAPQISTFTGYGIHGVNGYSDIISLSDRISSCTLGDVSDGSARILRWTGNNWKLGAATGATFGPAHPASLTTVAGLVTAAS